jgi:hypothetical protein
MCLRRFPLFVYLFLSLFGLCGARAETQLPNTPTRVKVASKSQTLSVNEVTSLRLALLDQYGKEIAAPGDTKLTLYVTKLQDVDSAKRDPSAATISKGRLYLPAKSNTVRMTVVIPRGQSALTVEFSSQQPGRLRAFAEGERLVTGVVLISVVGRAARNASAQSVFQTVAFQQEPAVAPAPARLLLTSADGTELPAFNNGASERTLNVGLSAADDSPVRAPSDIIVRLEVLSGQAKLTRNLITIKSGQAQNDEGEAITLSTTVGGPIKVRATADGAHPLPRAEETFDFPLSRRATKLDIGASPSEAMANGLDVITIVVRAVDDENNPIPAEVEGLAAREVSVKLVGQTRGLRFVGDVLPTIKIPKGDAGTVVRVVGSCPVVGAQIEASSGNISGRTLIGSCSFSFWFPWQQLGFAMFGGLLFPLIDKARRWRHAHGPWLSKLVRIALESLVGALIGGAFFGFVFFGAVAMTELKWGVLPIRLASLPVQSAFGACLIGLLGGAVFGSRETIKRSVGSAMQRIQAARAV